MNLLLDTHAWLWALEGSPRLGPAATRLLRDPANEAYLSAASCWEAAIKVASRKLRLSRPPAAFYAESISTFGFRPLPIRPAHALRAGELPRHHADPFDRLLVAQAEIEGLEVVTADATFAAYGVKVVPAAR